MEELDDFYRAYAYDEEGYLSPLTVKSYQALLDEFEPYRKTNRILDVGCGRGWFLMEAKKRGWEVFGSEYSKRAVELCEQDGITMHQGALSKDSFEAGSFDVVTSFEVIEHINNPKDDMACINQYLRPKGLLYVTTPNFNSLMRMYLKSDYNVIHYPEHLSYYTKTTLVRLAVRLGFKPVKFLSTGISLTRFNTSRNPESEKFISEESADERLRNSIDSKWYLGAIKGMANGNYDVDEYGDHIKGIL